MAFYGLWILPYGLRCPFVVVAPLPFTRWPTPFYVALFPGPSHRYAPRFDSTLPRSWVYRCSDTLRFVDVVIYPTLYITIGLDYLHVVPLVILLLVVDLRLFTFVVILLVWLP